VTSPHYRVLPGAEQSLVRLGQAGVMLGLVSGAMEGAARTKLAPANRNRFFIFGAYGSDSPDRAELTSLAIQKAAACTTSSPQPRCTSWATPHTTCKQHKQRAPSRSA